MKIGCIHHLGRMKKVWELLEKEHNVSYMNLDVFDYDLLVFGMLQIDETIVPEDYWNRLSNHTILVCGNATEALKQRFCVICLLEDEIFLLENAKLTAWGILEILIANSSKCLCDCVVDVIGYGRCGKTIVELLQAVGVKIRVIVKETKQLDIETLYYEEYVFKQPGDIIVQTAPSCIFDGYWVERLCNQPIIIDITSNFVGTSKIKEKYAVLEAKAIPDTIAVESAGGLYYQAMMRCI